MNFGSRYLLVIILQLMLTIELVFFSLRSAIEVLLWWMCHILSLKSSLSLLYWVPSNANKLWWCPRFISNGEVLIDSFHCLNPCLYSLNGILVFVFVLTISLFCCRFLRYFFIVGDRGSDVKSDVPFNNPWEMKWSYQYLLMKGVVQWLVEFLVLGSGGESFFLLLLVPLFLGHL